MKIDRGPFKTDPDVLVVKHLNLSWNGEGKFKWEITHNGKRINIKKKLMPSLLKMTANHCAFCDYYPLTSDFFHPSIEHFYPKCIDKYPEKAYEWENLFPSCNGCTEKKDNDFNLDLLKPDDVNYSFERYFEVTGDGKLCPSKIADKDSIDRAKITIKIYQFNTRGMLLSERKKWIELYKENSIFAKNPDEHPFRFLIPVFNYVTNPDDLINDFLQ